MSSLVDKWIGRCRGRNRLPPRPGGETSANKQGLRVNLRRLIETPVGRQGALSSRDHVARPSGESAARTRTGNGNSFCPVSERRRTHAIMKSK